MTKRGKLSALLGLGVAGTIGLSPVARAAEQEDSALEMFKLDEILIESASKVEESTFDAPATVQVVTSEQINSFGWYRIDDILYHMPGYAMSQDYDRPTVSSRGNWDGWNNNHLLLLVDGIPYSDAVDGTAFTWETTPTFLLKRMEVLRDPGSALYGTSAENGVIDIRTPSALDGETHSYARSRLGDYATRSVDILASTKQDLFGLVVAYNLFQTNGNPYEGFDGSDRRNAAGQLQKFLIRDNRDNSYVWVKLEGQQFLKGLTLQFHAQTWDFQTGHGWFWWAPDHPDKGNEQRLMASLSFRPEPSAHVSSEFDLRYQRRLDDWNIRFLPDAAYSGFYPGGVWEDLYSYAHDVFARAQVSAKGLSFLPNANALAGVEWTGFFYNGDSEHSSNADLGNYSGGYPAFSGFQTLPSYLGLIKGKPVHNLGLYAQATTGKFANGKLNLTLGARFDYEFFNYFDPSDLVTVDSKHYGQLSPRAALVYYPVESVSLKLLASRAFRAPVPAELFGANTWLLGSNITALQPEKITNYELVGNWKMLPGLTLELDGFVKRFDNQIEYGAGNVLTNVLSQDTAGVEGQLYYDFTLPKHAGQLGGFVNYTYTRLLKERSLDPTITAESSLTWFPANLANVGINYQYRGFNLALQGHFQGEVERRQSDLLPFSNPVGADFENVRPDSVAAFLLVDARVAYRFASWLQVGVQTSNLLGTTASLAKTGYYPFDYQMPGRRVMGTVEIGL